MATFTRIAMRASMLLATLLIAAATSYRRFDDVGGDPGELRDLGEEHCADLSEVANGMFPPLKDTVRPHAPLK